MTLGTFGSTLNDELNRLANGGTYRTMASMVDEALAAKQWANRENIIPYSTDTVGILNEIAGLGLDKKNWLDFNGVCNYIAGTTGLPAAAALRQVYNTTDLLTSQSAYYVDATDASASGQTINNLGSAGSLLPTTLGSSTAADSNDAKFLAHDGTNYVYLPGVAQNYLSVPDSAALDITGDIDIRAQVALDDWTPSQANSLVGKYLNTGNQRSYQLEVGTTGVLTLAWSTDGIAFISKSSTVATGVTDGTVKWVRATLDVDNGASGNDVRFFTSDNGTTWTQLGTTVTTAGVTSIFSGTAPVEIGTVFAGTTQPTSGKIYRAQIFSDITGTTKVLDVDTSVITTGAATSFTALTNQTVTINRSTSGRKTVAVTQPTWLFGTDDYMEVNNRYMAHSTSDENYVYLSGASGNNMTVADNPPLDITSDIDIRVKVALDDWTTPSQNTFISKEAPGDRAYSFYSTLGALSLSWSPDGSTTQIRSSSIGYTPAAGTTSWIRATLDVNNGAGGNTTTFYTSSDGITWTQLGTADTRSGTTSIYSGAMQVAIGSRANNTSASKGKFFRAQILNGINGPLVLDANAATITLPSQTTFTDSSSNAYTVTINKSGVGTFVSTGNYLYLPGINSNQATANDSPALDITGDIDVRVKVSADDWTPAAVANFIGKWQVTGNQRSWRFSLNTNGGLFAEWSADGTTVISHFIGPVGINDGVTKWVRWTLDVNNGASGNDSKFFTSDDGLTWTQVGATQTTAGVTSIYNSTAALEVGAIGGQNTLRAKFFRAQVLNGIGGTVAFDANFEGSITSLNQASFTESSSNAATVTINRSGSAYRSAGVIDAGYLYPGATNTFSNSTTDFLNFGATQDFTILAVIRQWNTPANFGRYVDKIDGAFNTGYYVSTNGTTQQARDGIASNGSFQVINGLTKTSGGLSVMGMIVNRSSQLLYDFLNGTPSAGLSTSAVGSLSNIFTFNIGKASASAVYQDFEFVGAAVFRTALSATQIRQIYNYFANREVYL